jgi:hypothetical protein
MDAPTIIATLGGPPVLAPAMGVSRTAVCNWRHDGIPSRHWPALVRLAKRTPGARSITLAALERAAKGAAQ